ncbi:hypothetical protein FIBSPDRAFT_956752, partial [Athelia psychrophila]
MTVITNMIAFFVPGRIFPSSISNVSECTDIDSCRAFLQILQPAVTALFAANYLSVHINIPRPNLPWYWRAYGAAKVFLVALIFPDWIFMWAVRSWIVALRKRKILEDARALAHAAWAARGDDHGVPDAWTNARRYAEATDEEYTIVHAFYVLMGGVHVRAADGTPLYPLDVETTALLVKRGSLLLPTKEGIIGLSKNTKYGKAFAVFQLAVFLLKCVLRPAVGLPLANFEITAFAHASIAILTFVSWWYKPMDVDITVRVSELVVNSLSGPDAEDITPGPGRLERPIWQVVYAHIFGNPESLYQL